MSPSNTTMRGLALDLDAHTHVRMRDDLTFPSPKAGEVRVRVTHSTINGHEFALARDPLLRVLAWLRRAPGEVRTGLEFAGIVDTDGLEFKAGDAVMGYVDMIAGWRPHAEYVAIPEAYLAPAPAGMPLAQASTLPMSGLTALVALREVARVQPGQRVLIVGASGGVGVMAVQIARILGAEVTALASSRHHASLAKLGAARCVDYRETPISALQGSFDAILDFSSTLRLAELTHLLTPEAVFIPADPIRNLGDVLRSRRARWLMVDKGDGPRLRELGAWVEAGELVSVVSETFAFGDWEQAVARSHERGRLGRTVLELANA